MNSKVVKIVVFAPESDAQNIRYAIGSMGAGRLGNYSFCSFSTKGIGRFKAEKGANPAIGEIGKIEEVKEERIEVVCTSDKIQETIKAIKSAHPYEEVALDVYPLENINIKNMETKRLYRSKTNKVFAGICGGLGEYANVDPVLIRLVWLLIVIFTGFVPGILTYIIAYFIVPAHPKS